MLGFQQGGGYRLVVEDNILDGFFYYFLDMDPIGNNRGMFDHFKLLNENLQGKDNIRIALSEDVTFLNKASVQRTLSQIPDDTSVIIDGTNTHFIHCDVVEIIEDFVINAETRNIKVSLVELQKWKQLEPVQHFELVSNDKNQ